MLPQSLVQNKIIDSQQTSDFHIDWNKAAPIVNLNFFYEQQLVIESEHYRKLLRPWTLCNEPQDLATIPTHYYFYADEFSQDPSIFPGSLVGCTNWVDETPQISIVYPSVGQYLYNSKQGTFYFSSDITTPVTFRGFSLSGLAEMHLIPLTRDYCTITDEYIIYSIPDNKEWIYQADVELDNVPINCFLLLETDQIWCRVKYNGEYIDGPILAKVKRDINPRLGQYEYTLTLPNNHYIISDQTVLEFY